MSDPQPAGVFATIRWFFRVPENPHRHPVQAEEVSLVRNHVSSVTDFLTGPCQRSDGSVGRANNMELIRYNDLQDRTAYQQVVE